MNHVEVHILLKSSKTKCNVLINAHDLFFMCILYLTCECIVNLDSSMHLYINLASSAMKPSISAISLLSKYINMRGFKRGGPKLLIVTALLIFLSIEQRVSSARQGKQFQTQQKSNTPMSLLREDGDVEFSGQRIPRLVREVYQAKFTALNAARDNTVLNVLDYGAKGDGTTDDTKVIIL